MHREPVEDFDDDDDDVIGVIYTPPGFKPDVPRPASSWLMFAALVELVADIFGVFHKLFNTLEDEVLANYRWKRSRFEFAEQAAREIEMMTGGLDATTKPTSAG